MNGDVQIPLREFIKERELANREWMAAIFATKDDVSALRVEIGTLRGQRQAIWGAIGTFAGAMVVGVLSFLGIKVPGGQP